MNPQGILLAAGYGRRFDPTGGQDKLLAPLADGRPVLWHSARALADALPGSLAVIRPGQPERARWLREAGCRVLEAPTAEAGMGHALAAAMAASAEADGWVVALADMPWLPPAAIRAVAARLTPPATVTAPRHAGRRGHPVGFGRAWGAQLMALDGDQGARALLSSATLTLFDWDDAGVLRDVDTRDDLPDR
ncbi:nucleotidyltransferase family protein [Denitromonas iodatirespirans]|uniref:Nucleotidyltransferase family protein n=1 Tax=Denitromonas iodatirespirans TaxID=2795389 RepID=A0A944DQR9_DENI1|nr:nucleotidyltransferase family protein [Denitromonas iodatirespirans]MBT0962884.1 nucleotidyltransferase family protein [Denitromonas iodatirespirans]